MISGLNGLLRKINLLHLSIGRMPQDTDLKLGYLRDRNAAAHSVDSDIF